MVSSKMDGSDPHFVAESIATHNTSWDLENDDVQADPTNTGPTSTFLALSRTSISGASLT